MILAVSRAVTDLERAGDEAKKIARFAVASAGSAKVGPVAGDAPAAHAHGRARLGVHAGRRGARSTAATPRSRTMSRASIATIDDEFEAALRQLMTVAMERTRLLRPVFDTVFALKSLERIGDHAKNVAEHVVFLVSGDDVRHAVTRARGVPARDAQH